MDNNQAAQSVGGEAEQDNAPESPGLASAKQRYSAYLEKNPLSSLLSFEHEGTERLVIQRPWGDRSVAIEIPADDVDLVAALNSVHLPARYTAIYHSDHQALEVIWTAYKLDERQRDIEGRKFTLSLPSGRHDCEFTQSSDRLLEIAKYAFPIEISSTGFRNLNSFSNYLKRDEEHDPELDPYGRPLSFFIRGVSWDDDDVIQLIRHVNFYLNYYDAQSPFVEIHPSGDTKSAPKNRYFEGFEFPSEITSPDLDAKLMIMYSSAFSSSSIPTKFLNLYRVIEYVALDYTHDQARQEIRRTISRPHALHEIDRTTTDLMLILKEIKGEREQEGFPRFVKEVIRPGQLWRELEINKEFFVAPTTFEGGLKVDAISTEKTSGETFGSTGVEAFARQCTKIRNGLAHGRDKISADSILPTSKNFELLRPWVNALLACAGEVVLYAAHH